MRILALDWGTVRVGGAISDEMEKIAFPLENYFESQNALAEIKKLVEEKEVEKILIGIPKSLAGENTASTEAVENFIEKLKSELKIEIVRMDERLSSKGASKTLQSYGVNTQQQREMVDNVAAQQMLQAYLDTNIN